MSEDKEFNVVDRNEEENKILAEREKFRMLDIQGNNVEYPTATEYNRDYYTGLLLYEVEKQQRKACDGLTVRQIRGIVMKYHADNELNAANSEAQKLKATDAG
jgi:hypothetical protein